MDIHPVDIVGTALYFVIEAVAAQATSSINTRYDNGCLEVKVDPFGVRAIDGTMPPNAIIDQDIAWLPWFYERASCDG